MKKIFIFALLLLVASSVFAEKITFRTGDVLALSLTDYFFPKDISLNYEE